MMLRRYSKPQAFDGRWWRYDHKQKTWQYGENNVWNNAQQQAVVQHTIPAEGPKSSTSSVFRPIFLGLLAATIAILIARLIVGNTIFTQLIEILSAGLAGIFVWRHFELKRVRITIDTPLADMSHEDRLEVIEELKAIEEVFDRRGAVKAKLGLTPMDQAEELKREIAKLHDQTQLVRYLKELRRELEVDPAQELKRQIEAVQDQTQLIRFLREFRRELENKTPDKQSPPIDPDEFGKRMRRPDDP